MDKFVERYTRCYRIRRFEKKIEEEFGKGNMRGTTHGCIGQEIIPVLVNEHIDREHDYITGTHRSHGQVMAYAEEPYTLFCEMMGRKDGFVEGMGGSQHIRVNKYITNGITGGMVVTGSGIALGLKKTGRDGVVVCFMGDGGFNEGYVQEAFNLSSHFELPVLYICENNHYAMSTPTEKYCSGSFEKRIEALDIHYIGTGTADIEQLETAIDDGFKYVREQKKPCFINVSTARLCGHSKSDKMEYMTEDEKAANIANDPLLQLESHLSKKISDEIKESVDEEIDDAYERASECEEK